MRLFYTLLLYLSLPAVLARMFVRGFGVPAYRRRWSERLGYFPPPPTSASIWIHAVSVGEAIAAFPLVEQLMKRYPQSTIVFTTTTPTGSERVTRHFGAAVRHSYIPYDLPGAVARFLAGTRPALAIILETEIWPNLYAACMERRIPLIIANARLSARSYTGYRYLAGLARATLRQARIIAAQSSADAERFIALGADAERVRVSGNLKFDITLPPELAEQAQDLRRMWGIKRRIWIAASTHEGEEARILDAYDRARAQVNGLLLVLVPRHPERFERIHGLCVARGYRVLRRTQRQTPGTPDIDIFLGDTMGELRLFYAAADIAFVGGSLVPSGGHNPLEPAALRLPVLHGPHMFNFDEISQLLHAAGAACAVQDAGELADAVIRYLNNPELCRETGARAYDVVARNRGALNRLLEIIAAELPR